MNRWFTILNPFNNPFLPTLPSKKDDHRPCSYLINPTQQQCHWYGWSCTFLCPGYATISVPFMLDYTRQYGHFSRSFLAEQVEKSLRPGEGMEVFFHREGPTQWPNGVLPSCFGLWVLMTRVCFIRWTWHCVQSIGWSSLLSDNCGHINLFVWKSSDELFSREHKQGFET